MVERWNFEEYEAARTEGEKFEVLKKYAPAARVANAKEAAAARMTDDRRQTTSGAGE